MKTSWITSLTFELRLFSYALFFYIFLALEFLELIRDIQFFSTVDWSNAVDIYVSVNDSG